MNGFDDLSRSRDEPSTTSSSYLDTLSSQAAKSREESKYGVRALQSRIKNHRAASYLLDFKNTADNQGITVCSVDTEQLEKRRKEVGEESKAMNELAEIRHERYLESLSKAEDASVKRMQLWDQATARYNDHFERVKQQKHRTYKKDISLTFKIAAQRFNKVIRKRKKKMNRHYGQLNDFRLKPFEDMIHFITWFRVPQTIQLTINVLRGVKDRLPKGSYILLISLKERIAGSIITGRTEKTWVRKKYDEAKEAFSQWRAKRKYGKEYVDRVKKSRQDQYASGFFQQTNEIQHDGKFSSLELDFENQKLFLVSPSKAQRKPYMVFSFNLVQVKGPNAGMSVAWGSFPVQDSSFNIIDGKYKVPMVRGWESNEVDQYWKMHKEYSNDIDKWVGNLYFQVKPLPRMKNGKMEQASHVSKLKQFSDVVVSDDLLEEDDSDDSSTEESETDPDIVTTDSEDEESDSGVSSTVTDTDEDKELNNLLNDDEADSKPSSQQDEESVKNPSAHGKRVLHAERTEMKEMQVDSDLPETTEDETEDESEDESEKSKTETEKDDEDDEDDEDDNEEEKEDEDEEDEDDFSSDEEENEEDRIHAEVVSRIRHNPNTNNSSTHMSTSFNNGPQQQRSLITFTKPYKLTDAQMKKYRYALKQPKGYRESVITFRKGTYLLRAVMTDLGLSSIGIDFLLSIFLFILCCIARIFCHYGGQFLFLEMLQYPKRQYELWKYYALMVDLNVDVDDIQFVWQVFYTFAGTFSNIVILVVLIFFIAIFQYMRINVPPFTSKFTVMFGFVTVIDPLYTLIVELAFQRYKFNDAGEWFLLMWSYEVAVPGEAVWGLLVCLLVFSTFSLLSAFIVYQFLLRIFMNGQIIDVFRRVHAPPGTYFLPLDLECSRVEMEYAVDKSKRYRGINGAFRRYVVMEYALTDPRDDNFFERSVHIIIYTLTPRGRNRYVRSVYRQFMQLENAAIVEIFRDTDAKILLNNQMKDINSSNLINDLEAGALGQRAEFEFGGKRFRGDRASSGSDSGSSSDDDSDDNSSAKSSAPLIDRRAVKKVREGTAKMKVVNDSDSDSDNPLVVKREFKKTREAHFTMQDDDDEASSDEDDSDEEDSDEDDSDDGSHVKKSRGKSMPMEMDESEESSGDENTPLI